jgi:hypothetical protein
MRTSEQKLATKRRKAAVRKAHRERVMKKYPPAVRYAKAKFKKGSKNPRRSRAVKVKIGLQ